MKQKKSQISLFIIVGFVLLITISFFIFILTYTAKKQVEKEQKQAQSKESRFDAVDSYITSCLERTSKNTLRLISAQGGVIYEEQGGPTDQTVLTEDIDYVKMGDIKVFAGIQQPIIANCSAGNGCVDGCTPVDTDCAGHTCVAGDGFCVIGCDPIDSDCAATSTSCGTNDGCGAWGATGLITCATDLDCGPTTCQAGDGCMLCDQPDPDCGTFECIEDGLCVLGCNPDPDPDCGKTPKGNFETKFTFDTPNYPWSHFPKDFDNSGPSRHISHLGITYYPSLDILTDNIKMFMKNNITECIGLTSFTDRFDIVPGTITTGSFDIKHTKKDTVFILNYPVNLKHPRTGDQATLSEFTYSSGLNLEGMHEHLMERITKDNRDLNYNITKSTTSGYRTRLEQVGNDDIVVVTSTGDKLDGIYLDLNFTRKNRKPALEKLGRQEVTLGNPVESYFTGLNESIKDPDEDIDCTGAIVLTSCDGTDCATGACKCVNAECSNGNIELDCPLPQTALNFKNWEIDGGITDGVGLDPAALPRCKVTISDNEYVDYQEEVVFNIHGAP